MQSGEFFEYFFSSRGNFSEKPNGEVNVLCPFPHDNGFETRPSAHLNVEKAVFHCKTCMAEGRFQKGGLSEIAFAAKVYGITYEQAVELLARQFTLNDGFDAETWKRAVDALMSNTELLDYLASRGITKETALEYQLGYSGDGIMYPVLVYGELCDTRTYRPGQTPKIMSEKGATPLLFPFDAWRDDERPTLLVAGENDCLLARQHGFNALTVTGGEGTFPKVFSGLFKGRTVYVCYDCDPAGKNATRTVAFYLKEAGANVKILDLGLSGTKEDKDVTDFFIKHGKSSDDLLYLMQQSLDYSEELFAEDKNKEYPIINLWDVPNGENAGRRASARVVLSGKYDIPQQIPTAIEWVCNGAQPDNPVCAKCKKNGKSGWWILRENLKDMMYLADVKEKQQHQAIEQFVGKPKDCPNMTITTKSRQAVYKVIFTPDVDTEDILSGHRAVEQYAYTVGLNLEDGNRYRAFYRAYAHPLDNQRVYMIVDRVEDSDNALNSFKMTDEVKEQLKVFQGDPFVKMKDRADQMHDVIKRFKPYPHMADAVAITYHSPLRFNMYGAEMKGYPEILMVGESRTGKTETALFFQRYVQLGNFMATKGATTAGLLGGADKMANGGFKINWGTIPRNHRSLVIMDEMSGMSREVMASLTSMRSERIATVHKIAKGVAPAETRLLWTANPRTGADGQSKNISDYPTGVQVLLDLIGSDEDVARFDLCLLVKKDDRLQSRPTDIPAVKAHPPEVYRNLILWAWSRKANQVQFDDSVESYVEQIASELNDHYDTDIKLFGSEAWKKLARIAVACAAACFSCTPDAESIFVKKEHVDWASAFMIECYDNSVFRLREYVQMRKATSTTNESINIIVEGICRTNPMVVKALIQSLSPMPMGNLQAISGLDMTEYRELIKNMSASSLIEVTAQGVTATRRFRLAVDAYRANRDKNNMKPLKEEGGFL